MRVARHLDDEWSIADVSGVEADVTPHYCGPPR
jgi:hypothetical protein